jgi:hypothetical protein
MWAEPEGRAMDEAEAMMALIARWNGVALPNEAARQAIADMAGLSAELAAVRDQLAFEDEPASFEAALVALQEPRR